MREWDFEISATAEKDLSRLDTSTRRRVLAKIKWLAENFEEITPAPLEEPWKGCFKLRIGLWRVVYNVEESRHIVTILFLDTRDKVYKRARNF